MGQINPSADHYLLQTIRDLQKAVAALQSQTIFSVPQYTTANKPTYAKGGMYFDTTLNKLRIGGASGWETVTSV